MSAGRNDTPTKIITVLRRLEIGIANGTELPKPRARQVLSMNPADYVMEESRRRPNGRSI